MTKAMLKVTDFGLVYSKGDKKIIKGLQVALENLRIGYFNRRIKGYDLQWLIELITLTRTMGMGKKEEWLKLYDSPYVTDHNQAFLEDSFDYLLTGRRVMNLQNWMDLVDFSEKKSVPVPVTTKLKLTLPENFPYTNPLGQQDLLDSMDYIERWCRWKDGPVDLLCTLFAILCGHPFAFAHSHFRFPYQELES